MDEVKQAGKHAHMHMHPHSCRTLPLSLSDWRHAYYEKISSGAPLASGDSSDQEVVFCWLVGCFCVRFFFFFGGGGGGGGRIGKDMKALFYSYVMSMAIGTLHSVLHVINMAVGT